MKNKHEIAIKLFILNCLRTNDVFFNSLQVIYMNKNKPPLQLSLLLHTNLITVILIFIFFLINKINNYIGSNKDNYYIVIYMTKC